MNKRRNTNEQRKRRNKLMTHSLKSMIFTTLRAFALATLLVWNAVLLCNHVITALSAIRSYSYITSQWGLLSILSILNQPTQVSSAYAFEAENLGISTQFSKELIWGKKAQWTRHKQFPLLPPRRSWKCVSSAIRHYRIFTRWRVYVYNILTGMIPFFSNSDLSWQINEVGGISQCDWRMSKDTFFHLSLTYHMHTFSTSLRELHLVNWDKLGLFSRWKKETTTIFKNKKQKHDKQRMSNS